MTTHTRIIAELSAAALIGCAALALSLAPHPSGHADDAPTPTPTAQVLTTDAATVPPVVHEAPAASEGAGYMPPPAPMRPASPITPTDRAPRYEATPQTAPIPAKAPLNCPAWTSPGVLGADGTPTSCLWNMPGAGGKLVLGPCYMEDSPNCYWDATKHGNGIGDSFININGTYFYAE